MHRGVYRGKSWLHRLEEKGMGASTSAQAAETEHAHAPASFKCKNAQNVCSSIPFHQYQALSYLLNFPKVAITDDLSPAPFAFTT